MYFDSHAHLSCPEMLPYLPEVLRRAEEAQVQYILNICTDLASLKEGLRLAEQENGVLNAAAIPPHDVEGDIVEGLQAVQKAALSHKLCAIGETGLDYHYPIDRGKQHEALKWHLGLALETQLPVIFHCREAFEDLFSLADRYYDKEKPAIVHCFTGTEEEAQEIMERGWHLSWSGILTFKKSDALREVAKRLSLSQCLLETDAPFLAPQSRRGQLNEPSFLPETALCLAQTMGLSLEKVAQVSYQNAKSLFLNKN